jgi:hypothetical protein
LVPDNKGGALAELDERSGFNSSNDNNGMIDISNLLSPSMHQTGGAHNLKTTQSIPALIGRKKSQNFGLTITAGQSFTRQDEIAAKNGSVNIKVRFERDSAAGSP